MALGGLAIFTTITNLVSSGVGGGLNLAASKRNKEGIIAAGQYNLKALETEAGMLQQKNAASLQQLKTGIIYLTIAIVVVLLFYAIFKWVSK